MKTTTETTATATTSNACKPFYIKGMEYRWNETTQDYDRYSVKTGKKRPYTAKEIADKARFDAYIANGCKHPAITLVIQK